MEDGPPNSNAFQGMVDIILRFCLPCWLILTDHDGAEGINFMKKMICDSIID